MSTNVEKSPNGMDSYFGLFGLHQYGIANNRPSFSSDSERVIMLIECGLYDN